MCNNARKISGHLGELGVLPFTAIAVEIRFNTTGLSLRLEQVLLTRRPQLAR
jgi:hypothetical protein